MTTRLRPSDSVSFFMAAPFMDQLLVKADSLLGDGSPAEDFFDAAASCIAEAPAFVGVVEQDVEGGGKVAGEFCRVGGETGDRILFKRDEEAGFAVNHHLFDASGSAGDHRSAAGHGFKVDDTEGLVD